MAEHFLNRPEIGTFIKEMSRKRMAQRMWTDRPTGQEAGILRDNARHAPRRDSAAAMIQEDGS